MSALAFSGDYVPFRLQIRSRTPASVSKLPPLHAGPTGPGPGNGLPDNLDDVLSCDTTSTDGEPEEAVEEAEPEDEWVYRRPGRARGCGLGGR